MPARSDKARDPNSTNRRNKQLGFEQLESRLMNTINSLELSLQLLAPSGPNGSTQLVGNAAPRVQSQAAIAGGTEVKGRTATASVLGTDDKSESFLRYNWQTVSGPNGGTITFGSNNTNAAKTNSLSFSAAGSYTVRVAIQDRDGASTSSTLQFKVVQTLTSLVIKNSDNSIINPGSTTTIRGSSQRLTAQGFDQFGKLMAVQPTINWQSISTPSNGRATLAVSGNSVTIGLNRAGSYSLRAQSGTTVSNFTLNATQTLSSISLTTLEGRSVAANQVLTTTSDNLKLNVRGLDQFGNAMTTLPSVTWSTTSTPAGGTLSVATTNGVATLTLNRAGSYAVKATSGSVSFPLMLNVVPTARSIRLLSTNDAIVAADSSISVSGSSHQVKLIGIDQFGQAMTSAPSSTWTTLSAPTGGSTTVSTSQSSTTFTFTRAGLYSVRVASSSSSFSFKFNVVPTLTSLEVTPGTSRVTIGGTQQFVARGLDQFRQAMTTTPSITWSTTTGTIGSGGSLTAGTQVGNFTVTARSGSLQGTANVEIAASTQNNQTGLKNASLSSLVSNLYTDGQLSRPEMMQILRSAGNDGVVDATELTDFQFLVSSQSFTMPTYVRELAKDVVNSNPANRNFKGQAAGNLAAGSSSTLLNNLVDKWFLGADEPAISTAGLSYQTATGNLFNGTPSRADARQGMLGDCYLIASLSAIADKNPDAVRNLFIDNGDGTYTTRFYAGGLGSFYSNGLISAGFASGSGVADYVTVNRRLPMSSSGTLGYSGYGQSGTSAATTLWIALAEKAYAQWNETGNEGRDGTNRYAAIEGGWMANVNAQVLGYNSTNYLFSSATKASLVNAIASNRSVTLGTTSSGTAGGLVGGHAYIVTGYNATTDTFSCHNPWGFSHPSPLTWAQLQSSCSMFTVTDPTGSVRFNSSIVRTAPSDLMIGSWTTVVSPNQLSSFSTVSTSTEDGSFNRNEQETSSQLNSIAIDTQADSSLVSDETDKLITNPSDEPIDVTELRSLDLVAELVDLALSEFDFDA